MAGTGWPRSSPTTTPSVVRQSSVSYPKNPSLTISRTINLYPLSNYTFGTKVDNQTCTYIGINTDHVSPVQTVPSA